MLTLWIVCTGAFLLAATMSALWHAIHEVAHADATVPLRRPWRSARTLWLGAVGILGTVAVVLAIATSIR